MRSWITIALSLVVLGTAATLAFRIEASFTKEEYVRPQSPVVLIDSSYDEGVWTISGSLTVPTACTDVVASPETDADGNVRVLIEVSEDTGICLARATDKKYEVEIEASEDALVQVYVNSVKAVTESL